MKFSDMSSVDLMHGLVHDHCLKSTNLEVIANSNEDVFDVVVEVNSLVDSSLQVSDEGGWIWNKYKKIIVEKSNHRRVMSNFKSRVSTHFLIQNVDLTKV